MLYSLYVQGLVHESTLCYQLNNKTKSYEQFNRIGEPEDIAKVVAFLASDDAKWISGQTIGVNGSDDVVGVFR